jgi:hypothetical protein
MFKDPDRIGNAVSAIEACLSTMKLSERELIGLLSCTFASAFAQGSEDQADFEAAIAFLIEDLPRQVRIINDELGPLD